MRLKLGMSLPLRPHAAQRGFSVLLLALSCLAAAQGAPEASKEPAATTETIIVNTTTIRTGITITTPATAPTAAALSTSWEAVPACTVQPTLYNSVADARGRRWGRLGSNDTSAAADAKTDANATSTCAYKDDNDNPVFSWETAPRCLLAPSVLTATADDQGRLWGQQFGIVCAFKAADSDRPVYDFLTAPACVALPEAVTSEADATGRLWGWESGHECAYKGTDNSPLLLPLSSANLDDVKPVSPAEMVARGAVPTAASFTWRATPACSAEPTKLTSVMDGRGRLWGWENDASCAYKDAAGAPVYDWVTAPRCLGDVSDSSSVDAEGRLWGWEAGASCAFKDLQQQPLRTWATALRCPAAPLLTTAVPDSLGRLWGWISDNDTSCAFKDARGNVLIFGELGSLAPSHDAGNSSAAMAASGGVVPVAAATAKPQSPLPSQLRVSPRSALSRLLSSRRSTLVSVRRPLASSRRLAQSASSQPVPQHPSSPSPFPPLLPVETPVQVVNAQALADAAYEAAAQQQALGLQDPNDAEAAARSSTTAALIAAAPSGSQQGPGGSSSDDSATPGSPHRTAAGGLAVPAENDTASHSSSSVASGIAGSDNGARHRLLGALASTQATAAGSLRGRRGVEEQRAAQQRLEAHRTQGPDVVAAASGHDGNTHRRGTDAATISSRGDKYAQQHHRRLLDSTSWYPGCKTWPAPAGLSQDASGRFWGSEGGSSCIYRDASGNPATLWDVIPACSADPTSANIRATDAAGRYWGWENSRSCAFKDGSGKARSTSSSAGSGSGSSSANPNDPWVAAPACSADPTSGNSKPDDKGRLWGWENSRSCAYKDAKGATLTVTTQASPSSSASGTTSNTNSSPKDFATGDVKTAPSCSGTPTMDTSQPDDVGYLWGWQSGRACVFRGADGKPLYYAALISGDWSAQPGYVPKPSSQTGWFDAPRCSKPPTYEAKPDSEGRLWGYENGQGCVFRDPRGYPLFYSDLQNGNIAEYYNKGSLWDNSPACPNAPSWSNARADNFGRLWGWDDKAGSSCAFKDSAGQAVFPPKQ